MSWVVLPDSGPLGKIIHPNPDVREKAAEICNFISNNGFDFLIPEIIAIETERGFENSEGDLVYSSRQLRKYRRQRQVLLVSEEDADVARIMEELLQDQGRPITDPSRIPSSDGILMAQAIHLAQTHSYDKIIILTENYSDFLRLLEVCNEQRKIDIWKYEDALTDVNLLREEGSPRITLSEERILLSTQIY